MLFLMILKIQNFCEKNKKFLLIMIFFINNLKNKKLFTFPFWIHAEIFMLNSIQVFIYNQPQKRMKRNALFELQ